MNGISPKVANGAAAAGGSSPVAILIIAAIGHWITLDPMVATAIGSVIASASGFLGGYLTRLETGAPPEIVAQMDELRAQMAAVIARLPPPANEPGAAPAAA